MATDEMLSADTPQSDVSVETRQETSSIAAGGDLPANSETAGGDLPANSETTSSTVDYLGSQDMQSSVEAIEAQSHNISELAAPRTESEPSDFLALENDGAKFFGALQVMGQQALELSANDVAGGFKSISNNLGSQGMEKLQRSYSAAQKIEVKSGWEPFKESVTTDETKAALIAAPLGIGMVFVGSFAYVMFFIIFCTAKYAPPALRKASSVVQEKAAMINEKAIVPLKQKIRPMIIETRAKIDAEIAKRLATYKRSTAAESAGIEEEGAEV